MSESKNLQRLPTRIADVGGIPIHRAIPQAALRKVGAWCFLDHAGPATPPPPGMQVGPHPHIGLQTFTWMIEGEVLHRDSLGTEKIIRHGQVNLMTAGYGIAHSEESQTLGVHAAQLWIALPDSHRNIPPRFQHYPDLPKTQIGDFAVTVLAGEALGLTAPAEVHTPLMGVDLLASDSASPARAVMPLRADFEHAVMSMSGEVRVEGELLPSEDVIYLPVGTTEVNLECSPGSRLIIIGGEPMDEAILLWWNFVARTTEEMQQAQKQWEAEAASTEDTINGQPRRFGKPVASVLRSLHSPSLEGVSLRASK
ncbi:pirin family protein [Comamonas sp. Y33R10-2]|uniref:pirin family protein n=1 Tax=Comamonas sp. Y33R10-2 TaxID=2853257 RepID=UPI001C5CA158|nr:pirin family protein [Comamonas sp. Y33R10-2]QXZ08613.1 pirin family protein [Comamonas sp. Y33R10-2]